MGCSHCLANASPIGAHITPEVYRRALDVSTELGDPLVMLSGGEPTEHPLIELLIREAARRFPIVTVLSNGLFLHDTERTAELMALGVYWQITNDPRFYPRRLPESVEWLEQGTVSFTEHIPTLVRLGRHKGESNRLGPACFNLRSATRQYGSFVQGVEFLRSQRKFCTPSIDVDGTIRAGESPECFALGTLWSSPGDLTEATLNHHCNRCGLHDRLPPNFLEAVRYA
jgi:hypothetical protein